jgi:hypothetical protein
MYLLGGDTDLGIAFKNAPVRRFRLCIAEELELA